MPGKKWAISGGAGFIGCHAAAHFHKAGQRVIVVDNLIWGKAERMLGWRPSVSTREAGSRFLDWIGHNRKLFAA